MAMTNYSLGKNGVKTDPCAWDMHSTARAGHIGAKSLEKTRQKRFILNRQKSLQKSLDCVAQKISRDGGAGRAEDPVWTIADDTGNKPFAKPRS
jgi:hypothetical protein